MQRRWPGRYAEERQPPLAPLDVEVAADDVLLPAGRLSAVLDGTLVVQARCPRAAYPGIPWAGTDSGSCADCCKASPELCISWACAWF